MVKEIGASIAAFLIAAALYWFLDNTHFIANFVRSLVGLHELRWPITYFSLMAVFSTGVLFLVAKLLKPITIVYPLLFGVLGFGWHVSIYNLSHLGWVAGVFGNGFYLMGGILYWLVTKHITRQLKTAPSGLGRS